QREAAIPHDDGGDSVPRRRARGRVPEELAVVVCVEVDEAGRNDQPGSVDLACAAPGDGADGADAPVRDGDVATRGLPSGAVAHERVTDHEIDHRRLLYPKTPRAAKDAPRLADSASLTLALPRRSCHACRRRSGRAPGGR